MWSCPLTKISYLRRQLPTCCNRLHLGSVCDALERCLHRDLTSFWNCTIVLHENGFVSAVTAEAHMLLRRLLGDCLSFLCVSDCITDRWSWPSESVPISLAEEGGSSTNPALSSCPYAHACAHAVHHNLLLLNLLISLLCAWRGSRWPVTSVPADLRWHVQHGYGGSSWFLTPTILIIWVQAWAESFNLIFKISENCAELKYNQCRSPFLVCSAQASE